jgi:hypothetical protein
MKGKPFFFNYKCDQYLLPKKSENSQEEQHTPVIPASWEAEAREC